MWAALGQGSGGGFGWPQAIKLLAIALVFGFSALMWLIRKLNEQAAIRRHREALQRQHDEALRTGRPESQPVPLALDPRSAGTPALGMPQRASANAEQEAKRRLQELAQRRRAELERLARQQGTAVPPRQPQSQKVPRTQRQWTEPPRRTVPPVISGPGTGLGRQPPLPIRPKPRQAPSPPPPLQVQTPASPPKPRARPSSEVRERSFYDVEDPHAPRSTQAGAAVGTGSGPGLDAGGLRQAMFGGASPASMRRAFLFGEIFGPPIGLRDNSSGAGSSSGG